MILKEILRFTESGTALRNTTGPDDRCSNQSVYMSEWPTGFKHTMNLQSGGKWRQVGSMFSAKAPSSRPALVNTDAIAKRSWEAPAVAMAPNNYTKPGRLPKLFTALPSNCLKLGGGGNPDRMHGAPPTWARIKNGLFCMCCCRIKLGCFDGAKRT